MFTGIIEERGEVRGISENRLDIAGRIVSVDSSLGASVAVSGCCLTVVTNQDGVMAFDLSEETLARTNLGRLRPGDPVNLERPVTLSARLGGHMVQGHVDGVASIVDVRPEPDGGAMIQVGLPDELQRYVVEKGSITLDGISLTVAAQEAGTVMIAAIPHTLAATTLGVASLGDAVNVEVDIIAKYVERLMEGQRT